MESIEYQKLKAEIEKVKFHNNSLVTLLGLLNEDEMAEPSIYETVVTFDLSKNDLRELTKLVQNFNGNKFILEQKALKVNPVFTRNNIVSILKSFVVSKIVKEKSLEILKSYE